MNKISKRIFFVLCRPEIPASERVSQSFWLGALSAICTVSLVQDWFGQDKWIAYISEHWIHMHWAWWLIPIVIIAARQMFSKETAKQLAKKGIIINED